jgi:type IV fimbrial biogenesis protein FimT
MGLIGLAVIGKLEQSSRLTSSLRIKSSFDSLFESSLGFSLIELCIVMGIIAALIFLGLPNFRDFLMRREREICLERLKLAIFLAQNQALLEKKTFTLCGSHNRQSCNDSNDWSNGYILFANETEENQPDAIDPKIMQIFPGIRYGRLRFDSNNTRLDIAGNGLTMQIGRFIYRPKAHKDADLEESVLVLNRACRTYRKPENQ